MTRPASILSVHNLSIHFGGLKAISELDFTIQAGAIHAIIGPNGAGKTTLFNLVTGVYAPTSGSVSFNGAPVTGKKPHELAALGMSRTFQNLQIFFNMSALDNVMVGRHLHLNRALLPALLRFPAVARKDRAARAHCRELMALVGCGAYLDAAKPKLLLLDEPAAGLNTAESREIDAVIQKVAEQGVTVVLVEHDMKMVMGISNHILVLDYGRKLTEGAPAEIAAHPEVIAAYLGAEAG